MSIRRFTRILLMSGLTVAMPALAEHQYCVDTVAGLDQAVRETANDDVVIKLVQGDYNVAGTALSDEIGFYNSGYYLTLRGGYTPGCGDRTANPGTTRLSDPDRSIVMASDNGPLNVESVSFLHASNVLLTAGLFFDQDVILRNVRFDGLSVSSLDAVAVVGRNVTVRQSIVVHNNAPFHCALRIETSDLDTAIVENTVIADNNADGLCLTPFGANDGWRLDAYNNILWNNSGHDISTFESNDLHLSNNLYHSSEFIPAPATAPIATIDADPQFNDPAGGNYFPGFASPALNSGSLFQPGGFPATDLLDDPRIIGSRIDRGPYESIVDDGVIVTVTNTSDTPASPANGSLRKAIIDANAGGLYREIRFALPGGCAAHVIHLASPLPTITGGLFINGYSQAGSAPNASYAGNNAVICVGIEGTTSTDEAVGAGGGSHLEVAGIGFGGFDLAAIDLFGGAAHQVWGNQFSGTVGGVALGNNAINVLIGGSSPDNVIGGSEPAQANVIGGAYEFGVRVSAGGSGGNQILGNLIGADKSGNGFNSNAVGVQIESGSNRVQDNTISGSNGDGLVLSGSGAVNTVVSYNRIGLKAGLVICGIPPFPACTPEDLALPNGRHGLRVQSGSNHNLVFLNKIASNGSMGISVASGLGNNLFANSIHDNASYGIDLDGSGGIDNDGDPNATNLPNRGLNFPTITKAYGGRHHGWVGGNLLSTNGAYDVQIFSTGACDSTGNGEGQVYQGSGAFSISGGAPNGNGLGVFHLAFGASPVTLATGRSISLISRDSSGNTSEFSFCKPYLCDIIFSDTLETGGGDSCPEAAR